MQVYAFLAEHYSRPLARVLFWAGAGPMMLLAVIIVGEWLARMRHDGHVNGSFQASALKCRVRGPQAMAFLGRCRDSGGGSEWGKCIIFVL